MCGVQKNVAVLGGRGLLEALDFAAWSLSGYTQPHVHAAGRTHVCVTDKCGCTEEWYVCADPRYHSAVLRATRGLSRLFCARFGDPCPSSVLSGVAAAFGDKTHMRPEIQKFVSEYFKTDDTSQPCFKLAQVMQMAPRGGVLMLGGGGRFGAPCLSTSLEERLGLSSAELSLSIIKC